MTNVRHTNFLVKYRIRFFKVATMFSLRRKTQHSTIWIPATRKHNTDIRSEENVIQTRAELRNSQSNSKQ